jgi:hypothetical protein
MTRSTRPLASLRVMVSEPFDSALPRSGRALSQSKRERKRVEP